MSELNAIESATAVIENVYLVYSKSEADKAITNHKYKRCLAMAQQLFNERTYWHYRYDDWGDRGYDRKYKWGKVKWCGKWGRKWLAIAEKFKEAKCVG